jgi:hypothetical protein
MKNYHCIKCDFEIKPIEPDLMTSPEQGMWSGGVVGKLYANYGSKLDGDIYIIAICDNCIKEYGEYVGNYMFPDNSESN